MASLISQEARSASSAPVACPGASTPAAIPTQTQHLACASARPVRGLFQGALGGTRSDFGSVLALPDFARCTGAGAPTRALRHALGLSRDLGLGLCSNFGASPRYMHRRSQEIRSLNLYNRNPTSPGPPPPNAVNQRLASSSPASSSGSLDAWTRTAATSFLCSQGCTRSGPIFRVAPFASIAHGSKGSAASAPVFLET